MWHPRVVNSFTPSIKDLWEQVPSETVDLTKDIQTFKKCIAKKTLGHLSYAMNKHPHPQVMCPVGCALYFDRKKECGSMPAYHYLATLCPTLTEFNAKPIKCAGFKPFYPKVYQFAEFIVAPSIRFEENVGMTILNCSSEIHSPPEFLYIQTPINPVYYYAYPNIYEELAPASTSPAIIRGGITGAHTTSHPVMRLAGNKIGLATMRLDFGPKCAPHIPLSLQDKHYVNNSIILKYRPEIKALIDRSGKYLPDPEGVSQYPLKNKKYEKVNPSQSTVDWCLSHGSFVTTGDALYMQRCNNESSTRAEPGQKKKLSSDTLKFFYTVVHPNDGFGTKPYNLQFTSDVEEPIRGRCLYLVINALLHCRPLMYRFLNVCWNSQVELKQEFLKMWQDIILHKNERKVQANFIDLESRLKAEVMYSSNVNTFHMTNFTIENTAALILHYLTGITVTNPESDYDNTLTDEEGVFILANLKSNTELPERMTTNSSTDYFLLHASHVDYDTNKAGVTYRWTPSMNYYSFTENGNTKRRYDFDRSIHRMAIYSTSTELNGSLYENHLPHLMTTVNILCNSHERLLIAERVTEAQWKCSIAGCNRYQRYRCSKIDSSYQCPVGLCGKCYNELEKRGGGPHKITRPTNLQSKKIVREHEISDSSTDDSSTDDSQNGEDSNIPRNNIQDHLTPTLHELVNDPLHNDSLYRLQDIANIVEHPERTPPETHIPTLSSTSIAGTFYNACYLASTSVAHYNRKPPKNLTRFLSNIRSNFDGQTVDLLYPLGISFPNIYCASVERAPVGALPLSLYGQQGRKAQKGGFASLNDHIAAQLRNPTTMNSTHTGFLSQAFDIQLDKALEHNSAQVVLTHGLEHINKNYVNLDSKQRTMSFDVLDSRKRVTELSYLMQKRPWSYYFTLTANDSKTPSLNRLRSGILEHMEKHDYSEEERDIQFQTYQSWSLRAWSRFIEYWADLVETSPEKPFGDCRFIWLRFEFQSTGAKGNKPHVHGGISLVEGSESIEETIRRCSNTVYDLFDIKYHTDYESLIEEGIIKDFHEYEELRELMTTLNNHDCNTGRCQKLGNDGKYHCRFHRSIGRFHYGEFEEFNIYSDKFLKTLHTVGLVDDDGKLDERLVAGIYHYPSQPGDVINPGHGKTNLFFKSKTDVRLTDKKQQSSYLCGYVAGRKNTLKLL